MKFQQDLACKTGFEQFEPLCAYIWRIRVLT